MLPGGGIGTRPPGFRNWATPPATFICSAACKVFSAWFIGRLDRKLNAWFISPGEAGATCALLARCPGGSGIVVV